MKRIVKFRGKSKRTGEWLYVDLVRNVECAFAIVPPFEMTTSNLCDRYEVEEDTIGQFTGLLDKNGKEIYESDIVILNDLTKERASVIWLDKEARFVVECVSGKQTYSIEEYYTIVGNIYDNPELLNQND